MNYLREDGIYDQMRQAWEAGARPITIEEIIRQTKEIFTPDRFDRPRGIRKLLKKAKDMTTTVLKEIGAFLFGRRYWANIVVQRWCSGGDAREGLAEYIFPSREEADRHRDSLEGNASWKFVETVSFRSRREHGR